MQPANVRGSHDRMDHPLRRERQLRGWSQGYVAEKIEAPDPGMVGRWERGVILPSPLYRRRLCELFEKSAEELMIMPSVVEELRTPPLTKDPQAQELQDIFDPSFYVESFIRQYKNWDLRHQEEGIVEPIFRSKLSGVYVPLRCENENGESLGFIVDFVQTWLEDNRRRNLVLLGEYGSGKTSCCLTLCYRLLRLYRKMNGTSIFPVYLNFRNISLTDESVSPEEKVFALLTEQYKIKMGPFSESQFKSTLEQHKFLLILDGLDEIIGSHDIVRIKHQFNKLKHILIHCHKVIITCRTNYFSSEEDVQYVFPLSSENVDLLDSMVGKGNFELLYLSDFEKNQQERYLQNTIPDEQHRAHILKIIHESPNISDLARRPILLSMIVKSFDTLLRRGTDRITQAALYNDYTRDWLRREFDERPDHLGLLSVVTMRGKLFILERLALKFFEEGIEQIHREDLVDFLSRSFEAQGWQLRDSDIDQIEYNFATCSFLIRTKDNYFGFAHRSFLEFFVAQALRHDLLAGRADSFGRQRLFGLVATFLADLIQHKERQAEIEERLVEWMEASRDPENSGPYLGGNSATLLCRLDFSCEGMDLSGVIFKYADLTGGDFRNCTLCGVNLDSSILTRTDFSGSDLQEADLRNTFVKETLFRRSNLQGTIFKNIRLVGGPNTIWKAAFSIDRSHIAVGTDHGDLVILAFRGKDAKEVRRLRIDATGVVHFAFSPDGELLAVADRDKNIRVYSWPKLIVGETQQPRVLSDNADYVRWLDFSPQGNILASGGRDHFVKLWYLEERSQVKELKFHSDAIMYTIWAPTGKLLASGGYDKNVCVWRIDDKNISSMHLLERGRRTSHTGTVRALAFSQDGTLLASSAEDNTTKLWSLLEPYRPKLVAKIPSDPTDGHIFCLEFVEDDKTLLIGDSYGYIGRIDIALKQLTHKIRAHDDMLRSFSVDEQAGLLLTASWDGAVKLWRIADLSPISDDNVLFCLDQEEILYQPQDAFQQANIKGIKYLSESFRRCFIRLGAIEE
jgi:WD40 repeat protein/transcriptional regulator with XRE-family HTH domain